MLLGLLVLGLVLVLGGGAGHPAGGGPSAVDAPDPVESVGDTVEPAETPRGPVLPGDPASDARGLAAFGLTRPGPLLDEARGTASATGRPVREIGNGTIRPVPVTGAQSRATGRVVRYTVEAEGRLGVDLEEFAAVVRRTLLDRRGWQDEEGIRFVWVSPRQRAKGVRPDVRVTLASPRTTDRLCAPMTTRGDVSCWNKGRAVINSRRWVKGAASYRGDLDGYRTYVINHEVGHGLGWGHEPCRRTGRRAPVMLQQTLGLDGCRAWPYPKGDGSAWR